MTRPVLGFQGIFWRENGARRRYSARRWRPLVSPGATGFSPPSIYNNFPWPQPTPEQRTRVEKAAQAVLAARAPHLPPHGPSTLADIYDPLCMPRTLLKAHAELDKAVERCYRREPFHSDRERVEHLFSLYEKLTAPLLPATSKTRARRSKTAAPAPRAGQQKTPGLYAQKLKPPPTGKSTPESEAAAAHFWGIQEEPLGRPPGLPPAED